MGASLTHPGIRAGSWSWVFLREKLLTAGSGPWDEDAMVQKETQGACMSDRFTPGGQSHRWPSFMGSKALFHIVIVG